MGVIRPARSADDDSEVLIIGAGPAGLSQALSLAELGLRVTVLEQQSEASLADPADDGREIALSHASRQKLESFGVFVEIGEDTLAPIRGARVLNGRSPRFLDFAVKAGTPAAIGYLISNERIRHGLYRRLKRYPNIRLLCDRHMSGVARSDTGVRVATSDGELLTRLLIAADSRHSPTRKALGIAASMRDFGKTMLVCRVEHDGSHEGIACEWFDLERTIATLPLHGRCSSLVITVPHGQAEQLAAMDATSFGLMLTRWLRGRLGAMRLVSPRFRYPLLATYAQRFVAPRAALIGDAAVGMHPVTAHGFNFGLSGQALLASVFADARRNGHDFCGDRVLRRYELEHRRHTLPLYLATNAIVGLYTSREPTAQLARELGIAVGSHLPPFKHAVLSQLMRATPG